MSTTWIFFSLCEIALPWLCALCFFRRQRPYAALWSVVAGLAVYEVFLFFTALLLGHLGVLDGPWYRIIFATATALALIGGCRKLPAVFSALKQIRYRPHYADILVVLCVLRAMQLLHNEWHNDWSYGTPSYDGLHYHIPRALQWLWHGDFRPYPTTIWQQLGHPYGGAATMLPSVFNGRGWLGAAYTALVLSVGAASSVALICRSFGLGVRASLLAGLVLLSCPTIGLRMIDVSTDIGATFPVIAATALVRTSPSLAWSVFLYASLVGVGAAIKQYAAFPAVPIACALFIPHTMAIVTSLRVIAAGVAGVLIAVLAVFLSMWPIYMNFGDFAGGGVAYGLSNVGKGWFAIRESLAFNLLQWAFEPLSIIPEKPRKEVFVALGLDKVWDYFGLPGSVNLLLPRLDRERTRAFLYSWLLLPWVVMGVKRGYRILAALGFLLVVVVQFAPLATNSVGARFTIIPLATYAVLWGARAARSPIIVGALVLTGLSYDLGYANRGHVLTELMPNYLPQHEVNKDLVAVVNGETVMMLPKSMALDAEVSGRLGQLRFEYVGCPIDDNWVNQFTSLKSRGRWFVMFAPPAEIIPGPDFKTVLSPECKKTHPDVLRSALAAAGWRFERTVVRDLELWTHGNTPAPY
jgi:hypothetical protein